MAAYQPPPPIQPVLQGLCDDSIGLYQAGQMIPAGPCNNQDPNSGISRDRCRYAQARPQDHTLAPNPDFRVCDSCHQDNRTNRWQLLWIDLQKKRAIMCKKCSKRLKRQNPNGQADACTCRDYICNPRTCFDCMNRKEAETMQRGYHNRDALLYTHKIRDRKTKRRRVVIDQYGPSARRRVREACPTPGCGEKPWVRG